MAIAVDRAAPADIAVLAQLMQEAYLEASYTLDRHWAARTLAKLIANPALGTVWLLSRGGHAAGFAVLTLRFSMEYGGMDAFIDDLFVRPEHRRQGVATAALTALFAECRRRRMLALHVEVGRDNLAANRLYRKFGLGRRPDRRQWLSIDLGGDKGIG